MPPDADPASDPVHPAFFSAISKAHRATDHIKNLEFFLDSYIKNGIHTRVEQLNGPYADQVVHIDADAFPSPIVSLIIGDAVRNLRDALDHAISAIFRELTGTGSDERSRFPFATDRASLAAKIDGMFISTRLDRICDVLIYNITPTKDTNPFIWNLNRLANADKHRQLTTHAQISLTPMADFETPAQVEFIENVIGIRPGSTISYTIPAGSKVKNIDFSSRSLTLVFDQDELLMGCEVISAIFRYQIEVFDILKKLNVATIASLPISNAGAPWYKPANQSTLYIPRSDI